MAFKFIALSALLAVASAGVHHHDHHQYPGTLHTHVIASPAEDAIASTHQNVVRTHDGTVSEYSKTVETPYYSVHKTDKRISNNNVYNAPKTVVSTSPAEAVYEYHESKPNTMSSYVHHASEPQHSAHSIYTIHGAPVHTTKTHVHHVAAPAMAKTEYHYQHHDEPEKKVIKYSAAPAAHLYQHSAPTSAYHHSAPAPVYHHATRKAHVYHHAAPEAHVYQHSVPEAHVYHHSAPSAHVYQHSAPEAHVYQHSTPAPAYHHQHAPAAHVYHHASAATPVATTSTSTYNHGPAASTYSHKSPDHSAYSASQTAHHYSPADMVSHVSFDGFGTHWDF